MKGDILPRIVGSQTYLDQLIPPYINGIVQSNHHLTLHINKLNDNRNKTDWILFVVVLEMQERSLELLLDNKYTVFLCLF